MKKGIIIAALMVSGMIVISCSSKRDPGRAYMPDMYYSRAYETYGYNNIGDYERLRDSGVFYNGAPVPGTVARGEGMPIHMTGDSAGLQYAQTLANPIAGLRDTLSLNEAGRIYNIMCGVCHGTALDGNGPLWKNGEGPYPVKPRELNGDYVRGLSDGHLYHVITYGKGAMGGCASQVKPEQRWWIINYIRSKQTGAPESADSTATAGGSMMADTATTQNR